MKKKEKEILIQEYKLLRNEFTTVVNNRGQIKDNLGFLDQKIRTPYLCSIIVRIFGSNSQLSDHFENVLKHFRKKAPKTYKALYEQDGIKAIHDRFAPFHYGEVKLRLMLIDEIIESLS